MRHTTLLSGLILASSTAFAANAADINDWPTSYTFDSGDTFTFTGNFAYDYNDFSGDSRLEDKDFMRRNEFGAKLKRKGVYDATVYFDFRSHKWLDVFFRVETKALFGKDFGKIRLGYMKTPVGLDANTSSRSGSFLEVTSPVAAFYEGRRTGVEWTMERPLYYLVAGAYGGKDLQGDNPGTTQAARGVWTPVKEKGNVVHVGLAMSVENRRGYHDGRGVSYSASARLRATPEAGLTTVRLVDSGTLGNVDQIRRSGLEGIWIHGPFSVQGEALAARITRENGLPDYDANGQYMFASWVLTGESRPYAAGAVNNVVPAHNYGAVEVLARYSRLDLDDADVEGGRQHIWTFGANWYLTKHFKFQANYLKVDASRAGVHTKPDIFELRAQVMF